MLCQYARKIQAKVREASVNIKILHKSESSFYAQSRTLSFPVFCTSRMETVCVSCVLPTVKVALPLATL